MPRHERYPYPFGLAAHEADENRLVLITSADRRSGHWVNKMTCLSGAAIAFATFLMVLHTVFDFRTMQPITASTVFQLFLLFAATPPFLALAYYFHRKEKTCDGGPFMTFYRQKGIVVIDRVLWVRRREFRFRDLEAFYGRGGPGPFGTTRGTLNVFAYDETTNGRLRGGFNIIAGPTENLTQATLLWSLLCQYMNPAEPLPNIPEFWQAKLDTAYRTEEEAEFQAAFEHLHHEYAVALRRFGVDQPDLGIPPHLDPVHPRYPGPRGVEHYRRTLAASREARPHSETS